MAEKKVGKITHYYDKIGVAVVELEAALKVGDTIRIKDTNLDFTQEVASMQVEHESVEKAGKGQSVGLKIDQPVKKGEVYVVKME